MNEGDLKIINYRILLLCDVSENALWQLRTVVSGFVKRGGGRGLTRRSKPHTHSNPTNLAIFRHKIPLYRFNQGLILLQGGGSNGSRG